MAGCEKSGFENKKFVKKYEKWCKSQGWKKGTGVKDCTGCKYKSSEGCEYYLDTQKRRPCPPWDCTAYEKGRRLCVFGKDRREEELF